LTIRPLIGLILPNCARARNQTRQFRVIDFDAFGHSDRAAISAVMREFREHCFDGLVGDESLSAFDARKMASDAQRTPSVELVIHDRSGNLDALLAGERHSESGKSWSKIRSVKLRPPIPAIAAFENILGDTGPQIWPRLTVIEFHLPFGIQYASRTPSLTALRQRGSQKDRRGIPPECLLIDLPIKWDSALGADIEALAVVAILFKPVLTSEGPHALLE
jgi:hypothetical protein